MYRSEGDCRCSESPVFICQSPDELRRQSDAFLVIYKPKHTQSAICAFTRMRTNQPKREERQHLLCGVAVYVPTKLIAATSRTATSNQIPSCTKNSATSIRASKKSEGEGGTCTGVRVIEVRNKPRMSPVQAGYTRGYRRDLYRELPTSQLTKSEQSETQTICRSRRTSLQHRRTVRMCSSTHMQPTYQRRSDMEPIE